MTNFQIDGGINWKGPIPDRGQDTIGVGASYLRLSGNARQQSATAAEEDEPRPLPRAEIVLEVTYQAQVTGWLQVQPDLQYIIFPAGQLTSEGHLPHNAVFIGVQTTISF